MKLGSLLDVQGCSIFTEVCLVYSLFLVFSVFLLAPPCAFMCVYLHLHVDINVCVNAHQFDPYANSRAKILNLVFPPLLCPIFPQVNSAGKPKDPINVVRLNLGSPLFGDELRTKTAAGGYFARGCVFSSNANIIPGKSTCMQAGSLACFSLQFEDENIEGLLA